MPMLTPMGRARITQPSNFIERILNGRVVPIISDEACFDLVLGGSQAFLKGYAGYTEYPFDDKENLTKVTKFFQLQNKLSDQSLKANYCDIVKSHIYHLAQDDGVDAEQLDEAEEQIDDQTVSDFAKLLDYPRLDGGQSNLLLLLANLPLKIYLTTSPYTFIEQALQRIGKKPRTEICRWRRELDSIDSVIDDGYRPSADEPLVYHLHGLDRYADSLVLTEDDYLEFLVHVAQDQGNNATDRVHALVRKALSDDLIVLGFRLNSWDFRVLYAGLIKPNGKQEDRGTCCLQLTPNIDEKRYLENYAQKAAKFDVFWGSLEEYAQKLSTILS